MNEMSIKEAKNIMERLGRAELEFVTSLTSPLYWVIKEGNSCFRARNGSAFFLDAGEGPFGVTACHVIGGLKEAILKTRVVACQLGNLLFDLNGKNSIIDAHAKIDIATFKITAAEVNSIGKTILTGYQKTWPPQPPTQGRGVFFSGFPGIGTTWLSKNMIAFGATPGGGVASSVNERDISILIEREHLIDVMGKGLPPENFDFGGISGGPVLTVVENHALRSWRLAGIIYQGPNPSADPSEAIAGLQIIKARRADFILSNGRLNTQLWDCTIGRRS